VEAYGDSKRSERRPAWQKSSLRVRALVRRDRR
jgi:hypothetical protein